MTPRGKTRTDACFIYSRLSRADDGSTVAVERQERDARAYAAKHGLEVVQVYRENDTSAYVRRKVTMPNGATRYRNSRPVFIDMVDALFAGQAKHLVAYDLDRLWRDPRDLEDLIDLAEHHGVQVHSISSGNVDLNTADGRAMARVMAAMARKSSDDTARRVRRAHEEAAELGRWHGGRRPFGYDITWDTDDRGLKLPHTTRLVVNKAEADALRESARRILAGVSINSTVRWLNDTVPPTRYDAKRDGDVWAWSRKSLTNRLSSPSVAGLRVHRGEVVGKADWEPIVEEPMWRALMDMLAERTNPGRSNYLLSGLLLCASCGSSCGATTDIKARGGKRRLRCLNRNINVHGGKPCPHQVNRVAAPIEAFAEIVLGGIMEFLARPKETADDASPLATELAEVERRLDEVQRAYTSGDVEGADAFPMMSRLRSAAKKLQAEQAKNARASVQTPMLSRLEFQALPVEEKRLIAGQLLHAVRLFPGHPGVKVFDPSTMEFVFAWGVTFRPGVTDFSGRPLPGGKEEFLSGTSEDWVRWSRMSSDEMEAGAYLALHV